MPPPAARAPAARGRARQAGNSGLSGPLRGADRSLVAAVVLVSRREHARARPRVFGPPARPDPGAGAPRCVLSGAPPPPPPPWIFARRFRSVSLERETLLMAVAPTKFSGRAFSVKEVTPDRRGRAGVCGLEPDGAGAHGVRAVAVAVLGVNGTSTRPTVPNLRPIAARWVDVRRPDAGGGPLRPISRLPVQRRVAGRVRRREAAGDR